MKNLILIIFVTISCLSTTFGQGSILFGVDGGVNFANLKYTGDFVSNAQKFGRKFGYQGGVKAGIKLKSFSLISGLQYVKLGGKNTVERNNVNQPWYLPDGSIDLGVQEETNNFSILSIPILLRYEYGNKLKFTLSMGAAINMGVGTPTNIVKYRLTKLGELGPYETKLSYGNIGKNLYKKTYASFQFSPGLMYEINDNGLFTFNFIIDSGGNIRNQNSAGLLSDGTLFIPSGDIRTNSMRFQIGYEHRINFEFGTKY